jgi:hypothetical protein
MLDRFIAYIDKEWAVLRAAPFVFVMLAVLCLGLGYGGGALYYNSQIGSLHEQISTKDGQVSRYRVALGIDPASKGALVELSNQELALRAQSIVAKMRECLAMVESNNQDIDKRLKDGRIDKAEASKEKWDDLENVDHQFANNLAADAYNVENELRSRLDPSALAHIVRAPALMFGSDPRSRVTFANLARGSAFEIGMLGPLANEMEQMAKLLPADTARK